MSAGAQAGAKLAANGLDGTCRCQRRASTAKRPERGQEIELQIDSLAHGGEGVARYGDGGYVVFVSGAIPGDRVRAVVVKRKRSYAHARTLEILTPSPERIPPTASHPGVPWQVLPYERQLEIKREQVDDALRRIGKLDGFELEEIVPALEQWRYRNKLEYSFGRDEDGALICGFHASAGWNKVEPIEDCLLASERGNRAREAALRWCREQKLYAWSRGGRPGGGRARRGEHEQDSGLPSDSAAGAPRQSREERSDSAAEAPRQSREGRSDSPAEAPWQSREQRTGPAPDGRPFLRNLVVREGRHSGKLQIRLVTTDGELEVGLLAAALVAELGEETLSGVLWTRSSSLAETTMGGETELVWGEAELPERIGRARPAHLLGSVPADQHRDGRAAVRDRRRLRRPGGVGARV